MHQKRVRFQLAFKPVIISVLIAATWFVTNVRAQTPPVPQAPPDAQTPQAQLVEEVNFEGLRRLRAEDMLYYVQTRQGDPYNEQQVQRDLQALLSLNFFDKTETRVDRTVGPVGVIVTFVVKELPIIRDLTFDGLKSVQESDVLKAFREKRVGISKEVAFDPVKAQNARRVLRELLAARGHPNATVDIQEEEVSATSTVITFKIDEGERVRVVEIDFEGNQVFSDSELRGQMKFVKEAGLISRFRGNDILDIEKLTEGDMQLVRQYMASKGYLQGRPGEPRVEDIGRRRTGLPVLPLPVVSSVDDALRVTIPIIEGKLYRLGTIKIEGNSIYSEQVIRQVLGLKEGDIADGKRISKALYEDLKTLYGRQGFIQYSAELNPEFRDNPKNQNEGLADFTVAIDEGKQFSLRRLEFVGNTFTRDNVLRREFILNEGDVYNQSSFEYSIQRLNQLGYFDPIDKEKDADFRTNEDEGLVDVNVKVAERGRQQISFNGGISGIGGSFFGLNYSTSNLLGRGESLSFNVALGNLQRSFVFSFTEPYIRNRPITVGFSIFTQSLRWLDPQGTLLSNNQAAQQGLFGNSFDFFNVPRENLFTQSSTGASVFASALLSEFYRKRRFTQFSRVSLSYSLSRTSVRDPEVNLENNQVTYIPVLYSQPNILTSSITPSFVYNSLDYRGSGFDAVSGREFSFSLPFAGLGGDVRTYRPILEFKQFIPVRRKTSDSPEVFGFRLQAGHIGSFAVTDTIRNGGSAAFINGVPIYERFFLGDEFTIRGYSVRSISPIAPRDNYIVSENVSLATARTGDITPVPGLSQSLANVGFFTGEGGESPGPIGRSAFPAFVGGDTQLLGNFEYRVPIFGPVTLAAYADIGSVFNLRKGGSQLTSTNFLTDERFAAVYGYNLNGVALTLNNPQLGSTPDGLGLVVRDARLVTRDELDNAFRSGPIDQSTGLPAGFEQVFLRSERVRSDSILRISESQYASIKDYQASVGLELRVQVPVVNVPFRLIYAYNPKARVDDPFFGRNYLNERKSVFRFSIGRTF